MEEDTANFFARVDFACLEGIEPTLVDGDGTELLPGITLHSLPGHTPGQMGMLVQLEHSGPVLLTSDAMYLHETYGPPAVGSDSCTTPTTGPPRWRRSAASREQEALIFPGHDETGIKQFRDRTELHTIQFWPGYEYE